MTFIKNHGDVSSMVTDTLRKNTIQDFDKMGLDLRGIDGGTKDAKIKRIAIQFEEMLINTLLKSAFKENTEDKEEMALTFGPVNDFRNMLMSQHIADNGGLGYRQVIEEQLKLLEAQKQGKSTTEKIQLKDLSTIPVIPRRPSIPGNRVSLPHTHVRDRVDHVQANQTAHNHPLRMEQPVESDVTSQFGWRTDPLDGKHRFHHGIDFKVPPNTPVKSFMDGEVIFSGWEDGYGNMVEIKHSNGINSRYGHNSSLLVTKGEKVKAGAVIARSGSSGRSTGPHLHFEIRKDDLSLNPVPFLKKSNVDVLAGG
ncbi:MAG: peptidoglycan DD-metalloendopeptidase family protein [bacterium]|nr:peptidoglycan DD-metalloendopeptidase family protein [bacterium]